MKNIIYAIAGLLILISQALRAQQQQVPLPQIDYKNEKFADIKEKLEEYMEKVEDADTTNKTEEFEGPTTQLKRWIRQQETHLDPTGHIFNYAAKNWDEYLKVKQSQQLRSLSSSSPQESFWHALNPTSNNTLGSRQGQGRIDRLAVDPNSSQTIYAGATVGGLWKSVDNGKTWNCITNNIPFESISAIAINPSNSSNIFITTGTDCNWNFGITLQQPEGLLVTYDGGNNWYSCNLLTSGTHNMEALGIAPLNNSIIVVGSDTGAWQSQDGGHSWSLTLPLDSGVGIRDLKFLPNSNTCIATDNNSTIWYSSNAGSSWTKAKYTPALSNISIIRLGVTPSDTNYVYAFFQGNGSNDNDYLYVSGNSGKSFHQQANITTETYSTAGGLPNNNQGYGNSIAVSETTPTTLYIADVNTYISTNSGIDWTEVGDNANAAPDNVHSDAHDMLCIGGSELFCANDGGVFYSGNAGNTSMTFTFTGTQLNVAEYRGFGGNPLNPNEFAGGTQDDGELEISGHLLTTNMSPFGDAGDAFFNPVDTNIVYYFGDDGAYISVSTNGFGADPAGATPPDNPNCHCADTSLNGGATQMIQFNPLNSNEVFAMYENFYYTATGSTSWSSHPTGFASPVIAYAEATYKTTGQADTGRFYAVISGGSTNTIYASTNSGVNWTPIYTYKVEDTLNNNDGIRDIIVNPNNSGDVFFVCFGYNETSKAYELSWSGSGLATVTNISSGLPNVPMWRVAYQNSSSPGIYVGTDIGVFFRPTSSGNWLQFSDGLPFCHVVDLEVNTSYNVVSCATYGRGIWQAPLYTECPAVYTVVPGSLIAGEYIEASDSIYSASAITGSYGTDVSFNSGMVVTFLPGFSIDSGSGMQAYIRGCESPLAPQSGQLRGDYVGPLTGGTVVNSTDPRDNFSWRLMPNPASNYVNISYTLPSTETVSISILDINGREIRRVQEDNVLSEGNYSFNVDISGLSNQVYLVRMICNGTSSVSKLVVSR